MYDAILVPTDGSPAAERAVDHAIELASTYGATVHALYVIDVALYSSLEAGVDVVIEALEREGDRAARAVKSRCVAAGLDTESAVLVGTVHRGIQEYIGDNDIDLVVMGTHGRKGIERFILGSVTERTVRSSPVPVLTVRAGEDAADAADAEDEGDEDDAASTSA